MNNDILGNFYRRALPLYQPRAQALFKRTQPSDLQRLTFRYIFNVDGMIEISHMIEDIITSNRNTAHSHVSFQYFSRLAAQLKRYELVAQASNGLWLYGVPDAPLPALTNTTYIDTSGTPLENYWFVTAYGPGLSATLLAEEITPAQRLPGEPRIYEGFYTFETDIAYQVLAVLHQLHPAQVPNPPTPEQMEK
ncbi:MAG TPA: DICT sensory domain-containing protein [Anaerolineales bacterium]